MDKPSIKFEVQQKYVVMPFAKDEKATPTYVRARSGALGDRHRDSAFKLEGWN